MGIFTRSAQEISGLSGKTHRKSHREDAHFLTKKNTRTESAADRSKAGGSCPSGQPPPAPAGDPASPQSLGKTSNETNKIQVHTGLALQC